MIILVVIIHVIVCVALIGIVLIQRGRGGGLVEGFAGVESMFGTKTSKFLTRLTTTLSILFFITCLSLAALSLSKSKSLIRDKKIEPAPEAQAPVQPARPEPGTTQAQGALNQEVPE